MEENRQLSFVKAFILALLSIVIYSIVSEAIWEILYFMLDGKTYDNISYYIVDTAICAVCLVIYAVFLVLVRNIADVNICNFKKTNLKFMQLTAVTVILALGMSGFTTQWLYFVYEYLEDVPFFKQSIESYDEAWGGIEEEPYFFVFMSVVFLGPIIEELMFRGLLFNILSKKYNVLSGAILSGLIFGIWHMELIQSVYTAIFGIAIALLYAKTKSLFFPSLCHIVYNFVGTLPPELSTDAIIGGIDAINAICIIPSLFIVYKLFVIKREDKAKITKEDLDSGAI